MSNSPANLWKLSDFREVFLVAHRTVID